MRKIIGTSIHYGMRGARRVLKKHPRLKKRLKRVAMAQFAFLAGGSDPYKKWVNQNLPDYIEIPKLRKESQGFAYTPLISIIVPIYGPKEGYLRDCIESVIGQVYENWELCLVDDASPDESTRIILEGYASQDSRIKTTFLKQNHHIAGATNKGLEVSSGEYVALLDNDDILWPNALFEIVKVLQNTKDADFLYTDEEKITDDRHEHLGPFFKPDWNPDFLHSVNYITHFSVIRTSLMKKIGGLRAEFNGAQDWDLALRISSETNKIVHVPKVVYSWRVHSNSTAQSTDAKPYVVEAQQKLLKEDLKAKGYEDAVVERDKTHSGYWRVRYPLRDNPKVSIVIPTLNQFTVIKRCISSIVQKSTYTNYEIIIVDTGSTDTKVLKWYEKLVGSYANIRVVEWSEKPWSYARSCNEGARQARGDILIMLNNDTEVITPDWIEVLASEAQRKEVGAVGCLLFFPDGYHVQHAGVGVGLGGVAANSFSMMTLEQPMSQTQHLYLNTRHNMTAVTAACLAIRKRVYDEIGGFDEGYRVTYNDVDLSLRLHERGYLNVYTPYARLIHHESITVGLPEEIAKRDTKEMKQAMQQFKKQWAKYIEHDPNINPNLSKDNAFYDIPAIKRDITDKL